MTLESENVTEKQTHDDDQAIPLGERDKAILQIFATFISSLAIAFAITYSDFYIGFLGLLSVVLSYILLRTYSEELSTSMKLYINPLEEAILILLLYLSVAWVILPLLPDLGILFSGIVLLLGSIPILLIFTRGWGYSLKVIGLKRNCEDGDDLAKLVLIVFFVVFLIRMIPYIGNLPLLLTPDIFVIMVSLIVSLGIITGFVEELVFRGIIQPRLSQFFRSRVTGLLITSSLFALLHFLSVDQYTGALFDPVGSMLSALMTRLGMGLVFGIVQISSKNITHPWAIHAMNNSLYSIMIILEAL